MESYQKVILFVFLGALIIITCFVVLTVILYIRHVLHNGRTDADARGNIERATETAAEAEATAGELERTVEGQRELIEQIKKQKLD